MGRPSSYTVEQWLVSAITARHGVDIKYRDAMGEETTRSILPYYLVQGSDGKSYVHAYCWLRKAKRTFRTDRIEDAAERRIEVPWAIYCAHSAGLATPPCGKLLANIWAAFGPGSEKF